jgi:hypothetical protein
MPSFLIPVVVVEVLAVVAVIWSLSLLLTRKFPPDELDRIAARRTIHNGKAIKDFDAAAVSAPSEKSPKSLHNVGNPPSVPATERDRSAEVAVSAQDVSEEIDPSWPPPVPKSL